MIKGLTHWKLIALTSTIGNILTKYHSISLLQAAPKDASYTF